MAQDKDRQAELLSIALGARRRDAKLPRDRAAPTIEPGIPAPAEDTLSDFIRSLTPEQRELYRRYLQDSGSSKE